MATQRDVRRIAMSLPETVEAGEGFAFSVPSGGKQKGFAWVWQERVEPKKPRIPNPEVVVLRVADQHEKDALLASDEEAIFAEPHYNGFPAILVRLAEIEEDVLNELITDAWRCQAPRVLVAEFDERNGQ